MVQKTKMRSLALLQASDSQTRRGVVMVGEHELKVRHAMRGAAQACSAQFQISPRRRRMQHTTAHPAPVSKHNASPECPCMQTCLLRSNATRVLAMVCRMLFLRLFCALHVSPRHLALSFSRALVLSCFLDTRKDTTETDSMLTDARQDRRVLMARRGAPTARPHHAF